MSYDLEPVVGHWYRVIDKRDLFRVVGVDGDNDAIKVRWFDGNREEIESESWFEMDLEEAEAPEGWTDAGDDIEEDDAEDADEPDKKARAPRKDDDEDDRLRDWDDDDDDDDEDDDDEDDDWDDDDSDR